MLKSHAEKPCLKSFYLEIMVKSYTVVWSLKEGQAKSHAKSCDKIMLKIWPLLEIMQKVKLRWDIVVWFEGRSNWEEEEGWRESQGVISTFIFPPPHHLSSSWCSSSCSSSWSPRSRWCRSNVKGSVRGCWLSGSLCSCKSCQVKNYEIWYQIS